MDSINETQNDVKFSSVRINLVVQKCRSFDLEGRETNRKTSTRMPSTPTKNRRTAQYCRTENGVATAVVLCVVEEEQLDGAFLIAKI
jgi:hypothetical protein